MMNEQQQLERFSRAKSRRMNWEGTWQEIFDYVYPGREGFSSSAPGQRKDDLIFDETAVVGVQEFASRMLAGIVPNNMRWARFEPSPRIEAELDPTDLMRVQGQLDEVTQEVFEHIENSNFQQEAHESFLDLAVGTGSMVINRGDDSLKTLDFASVPMHTVYLEEGPFGGIDGQYRVQTPKAEDIALLWPDAKLTNNIKDKIDGNTQSRDGETKVKILECTHRDWSAVDTETYLHYVMDVEEKTYIVKREYKGIGSSPWVNFRWAKASNEIYGRGPAYNALAAIKTCNLTVQLILENAEMSIAGMWQLDDDGVINPANIRLVPGTVIPRSVNARGLEPLASPGNFDVAQLVLQDMRHNINRALYNETLGRREGTPISATEVAERMAELSRQLGAVFGRLQTEFVFPTLRRVVYLLKEQGRIELPTLNGQEVKIRAVSPLIRAQRNEDISQHVNFVTALGQLFGPAAVQTMVNPQNFAEQMAKWYQIDASLLRSEGEQEELAQQTAQAASQMQGQGIDPVNTLRSLMP